MKRAMNTVKNIAAAAMTLAVFFGFAGFKPVTANAAQAAMLPPLLWKKRTPTLRKTLTSAAS